MKPLLKVVLLALFLAGSAYGAITWVQREQPEGAARGGRGRGGGQQGPLKAEALVVRSESIALTVHGVGVLSANESVSISSEQSRRLAVVHVQEGQEVTRGDILFELDDADLSAQLKELEARLSLAMLNEERLRELRTTNSVSPSDYDNARTNLEVVAAQIEVLKVTIAKTKIRAPFDGRVGIRRASVGAWVTPDTPLTTLQDLSRLKVDFKLPERHASALRTGLSFRFRPEGRGEWKEGTITAIEPAVEAATRSLLVRGVAPNPERELLPGAFVSVEVTMETVPEGLMVPTRAVLASARGNSVYVLQDGHAILRPVELGLRRADTVQVVAGLVEGETLVTSNLLRLRDGSEVEIVAPGTAGPAADGTGG